MPLVFNAIDGGHTDRQTHILTREPNQFQETRRKAEGLTWLV